jgi:hypothetical protein
MRARRFILLLDPRYSVEMEALNTIKAAPEGERAAFLRALILIGFGEIKKDKSREQYTLASASQPPRLEEEPSTTPP